MLPRSVEAVTDPDLGDGETMDAQQLEGRLGTGASGWQLRDSRLASFNLSGAVTPSPSWSNCVAEGCELSGWIAEDAKLSRAHFVDCRARGLVLPTARLTDVVFERCRLDGASFRYMNGTRVAFVDCDLRTADFYRAELVEGAFIRCDLTEAGFSSARLRGTDLRGSTLDWLVGGDALAGTRIDPTQLTAVGLAIIGAFGITVDDSAPDV
jgi:uncharacterized protein YjbI with pentapeptide repeats